MAESVARGSYGAVAHTMTITKVDAVTGRVLEVGGLGGLNMAEYRCPPEDAWPKMGTTITYHTRKK